MTGLSLAFAITVNATQCNVVLCKKGYRTVTIVGKPALCPNNFWSEATAQKESSDIHAIRRDVGTYAWQVDQDMFSARYVARCTVTNAFHSMMYNSQFEHN